MSTRIDPRMALECKHCGLRPPEDSVMEALQLHFQVEHDTDKLDLNLVAVCSCGATMDFEYSMTQPGFPGDVDYFVCPACCNRGQVRKGPS